MKGKKSLVDLKNFRSTRLKELTSSSKSLGAISIGIRTTSFSYLPPSYVISKDSIKMCEFVGSYKLNDAFAITNYSYDTTNLTYLGGIVDSPNVGGWYILNDGYKSRTSISNNNYTFNPFNGESGYLFVFFFGKYGIINRVCSGCYYYASQEDSYYPPALCKVIDTNQGEIFTVLIQNISQINALNQTYAYQSSRLFLSNTINDAFKSGNQTIKNFINDIKDRNNDYSTPILSYDPVNPLSLFPLFPDPEVNVVKFSGMQYTTFNIKDRFLPQQTFISFIPLSSISKFLPLSHVQKLSFSVQNLSTFDFDDNNKPLSGVAELVDNKTSIKFLTSGFCIISYTIGSCEDVENIYENPKGPSFYGPKVFSVRIKATIYPT